MKQAIVLTALRLFPRQCPLSLTTASDRCYSWHRPYMMLYEASTLGSYLMSMCWLTMIVVNHLL